MFVISRFSSLNNRRFNKVVDLIFRRALFKRSVVVFYFCQNSAESSLFLELASVQKLPSKCKWLGNTTECFCSIRGPLSSSIESAIKKLLSPQSSTPDAGGDCRISFKTKWASSFYLQICKLLPPLRFAATYTFNTIFPSLKLLLNVLLKCNSVQ